MAKTFCKLISKYIALYDLTFAQKLYAKSDSRCCPHGHLGGRKPPCMATQL